jgi:hypothetical protein
MKIEQWRSYLKGYMINDRAKKANFQQIAAEPLILPAQGCFVTPFNNPPTEGGIRAQLIYCIVQLK